MERDISAVNALLKINEAWALAAELRNMRTDLFQTTKPRKVTVICRGIRFPVHATAHIEEYNLLIELAQEGHRDHPWTGFCFFCARIAFARSPRRSGRASCRRSFL